MTYSIQIPDPSVPEREQASLSFIRENRFGQKQARLLQRFRLRPDIDLGRYSCRAVLDYAELHLVLGRPTQFRFVQDAVLATLKGRTPHVRPIGENPNSATEFLVRLQEPELWRLRDVRTALDKTFGLVGDLGVHELEVSIDFYAKDNSYVDRARMVALLQRLHRPKLDVWSMPDSRPRFIHTSGSAPNFILPSLSGSRAQLDHATVFEPCRVRMPSLDATYYLGARTDDIRFRVQHKQSDQRTGSSALMLAEEHRRARIEVTLGRRALVERRIWDLAGLEKFGFNRLQGDVFQFALPTFPWPQDPQRRHIEERLNRVRTQHFLRGGIMAYEQVERLRQDWFREKLVSLGGRSRYNVMRKHMRDAGAQVKVDRHGSGHQGFMVAYQPMNDLVQEALRDMTRRARRKI